MEQDVINANFESRRSPQQTESVVLTVPTFPPCFGLIPSITSSQSGPCVTSLPVIRSLLRFGEQQTSETVGTFPVEWSQQPHDLINGDKHKPAVTSATLHGNREAEDPIEPHKRSLQVFECFSLNFSTVFTCLSAPH